MSRRHSRCSCVVTCPPPSSPEAQSQDLAVFDYFQRVNNDATGELITAGTARYAFDRKLSELVDCCGAASMTSQ